MNNTDSKENAKKIISTQKDFNKYVKNQNKYTYSNRNSSSSSFFKLLFNLKPKARYILATIVISLTIGWLFNGSHNYDYNISNDTLDNNKTNKIENKEAYNSQSIPLPVKKNKTNTHDSNDDIYNNIHSDPNAEPSSTTTVDSSGKSDNNNIKNKEIRTKIVTIKKNDNLSNIFKKINLNKNNLIKIISNKTINKHIKKIRPGQQLEISYNKNTKDLTKMVYNLDKFNLFIIEQDPNNADKFISKKEKLNVTEQTTYTNLTIKNSLFEDAQKQGLSVQLVMQILDIFTWDIDFAQDLRTGDTVEILYKKYYLHGTPYATGPVLAVNFNNSGKTYKAIRYESNGHADYYTPQGLSLRKAFIRTPVKFTRISSRFSLGRKHPLLHKIRAHRGVDYAAPTNTPIKAAGDGKIIHYGRKGGYGKAAVIQHGHKYTTLYAHMSRYNSKIKRGTYVKQGQVIGYVGQTGLATGPHLHFEFRVNGKHKNPLTVPLPKAKAIANKHKIKFIDNSNKLLATLNKFRNHPIFDEDLDKSQFALSNKFE